MTTKRESFETKRGSFEIKDRFYLNGKPFQIISGGIHYFRVLPEYWEDRLRKLKELGCNCVETYIPWNMHEPQKGVFDFYGEKLQGMLDVAAFIRKAQELGLWVILRPSPYICGEWDFGGLPAWLLTEEMELRTSDERYLRHVREYYSHLLPILAPLQIDRGGPVIMMQVENEYGSFGNDKKYLESLRDMMREGGISIPLFASDGPGDDMLSNSRIEGVFPTVNFGSGTKRAFQILEKYTDGGPCMCTEFWIGWFDAWKDEKHHTGNMEVAVRELEELLKLGNVNIYMFEGGTNFGFMNGANYFDHLTTDVTSYDYGALLTENGEITEKYWKFQEVIQRHIREGQEAGQKTDGAQEADDMQKTETPGALQNGFSELKEQTAFPAPYEKTSYGEISCSRRVDLFHALPDLAKPVQTVSPRSMELLGQSYGYMLYSTCLQTVDELESLRLFQAADRAIVYADGQKILVAEDRQLLENQQVGPVKTKPGKAGIHLDILMENMGRVNYGFMVNWQRKGIDGGVLVNDFFFQNGWQQYCLPLDNLEKLDYTRGYEEGMPAFYRFVFRAEKKGDTFLDFAGWGKGCAFVNGFALGRFWEQGPQRRLYLPGSLLKEGENEIILFETEGKCGESIVLQAEPDLG